MYRKTNEGVKQAYKRIFAAFNETVLSHPKARYLSLSERSAMIGCLHDFVNTVYSYIDKK